MAFNQYSLDLELGSSQYAWVADNTELSITSDISIEAWVKLETEADTPSVTWTARFGSDRSAAGTEVVTAGTTTTSVSTGSDVTSFDDATIPADNFVWLEVTAQSGTVTEAHLTIIFTED